MKNSKKAVFLKKEKVINVGTKDSDNLQIEEVRRSAAKTERAMVSNAKKRNLVTFIEME